MISFESLLKTFHEATLAASDALKQKNQNIIDEYFELVKFTETLNNGEEGKRNLWSNQSIFREEENIKLRPKTITIQYPKETQEGPTVHDVQVPLISIVPISQTAIDEVTINTELELALKDDELMVSFPQKQKSKFFDKKDDKEKSCTKVEIKLRPTMETEGLKKLVEGYDKLLRAQIPG